MPKKRCKSCLDFGKGMFFIALSFSGSGEIPITDILCPKNISLIAPKHTGPYLISNLTFEFYLGSGQCKSLIGFGRMPI